MKGWLMDSGSEQLGAMQVPINGGTDYAIAIARASLLLRTAEPSSHVSMVLLTDGRVDPYQGVLLFAYSNITVNSSVAKACRAGREA